MKNYFRRVLIEILYRTRLLQRPTPQKTSNEKDDLLNNFYSILKKINYTPRYIVDVGANHGGWTRNALLHFPDAEFTLLEPQEWLKKSIEDVLNVNPKVKFFAVGAGEFSGSLKFTIVDRDDSCSFSISEEEARLAGYRQVDIPVKALSEFIPTISTQTPDIIKIDAEGLDLAVLRGAKSFFGRTEIFMVEVGVVNKQFQNSFLNVIQFMDENGYRLFEITDLNRPLDIPVLWLAELVFVKKDGRIDQLSFIPSHEK